MKVELAMSLFWNMPNAKVPPFSVSSFCQTRAQLWLCLWSAVLMQCHQPALLWTYPYLTAEV